MKGTVYSGIVYLPSHPLADMHGLVRACLRSRTIGTVHAIFERHEIPFWPTWMLMNIWQESKSAAEITATEKHYGEILVCSLVQAYLSPDLYIPIGRR